MSPPSEQRPLVTAVVVSYRSRDAVAEAVAGLKPSHEQGLLRCIVVDNASSDGTVELLQRQHAWVEVVASQENVGFGRGCNLGIERATTPYVLLLNPDAVLPPADLALLLEFMADTPRAGIVAPAIRSPDGSLQHVGGAPTPLRILRQALSPGWHPPDQTWLRPGTEPFRTEWLCGAVLLLRTSMLREIGSFDPRFFLYFEETDLCRRARARDWELWAVGQAQASHAAGLSARATGAPLFTGCIAEHYFRSRFRFLVKHYGRALAVLTECGELLLLTVSALARVVARRDVAYWRARLRAPIFGLPR